MDELRCNNLRCRKSLALEGSAVVTTCSHIFCIDCANALFSTPQICPACETSLTDLDDIMQTSLNPHDSYKTSILSGLSPAIILDIASRALNFYSYQIQQEAAFQALITKNAQERISILEAQLNAVTREANAEIARLKERVATSENDLEMERRRVRELQETHKANAKAYSKLKTQYDKAKQRALLHPGDPNLAQAFTAHLGSSQPQPSPAATRQTFIPAPGNGTVSRSASSASAAQERPSGRGAGGWPNATFPHTQQHAGISGSALRSRRPLKEQHGGGNTSTSGSGFHGGHVGAGAAGGTNSTRRMNLVNATGHRPESASEGLPHFLGQGVGPSPRVGVGGGRAGGLRPAGYNGRSGG